MIKYILLMITLPIILMGSVISKIEFTPKTSFISSIDISPAVQNESLLLQTRITLDWITDSRFSWRLGGAITTRGEILDHPERAIEDYSSKMIFGGIASHQFWRNFAITTALNVGVNLIESEDPEAKQYQSYYIDFEGEVKFYLRFTQNFSIYFMGSGGMNRMISTNEPSIKDGFPEDNRQEQGFKVGGGVGIALLF